MNRDNQNIIQNNASLVADMRDMIKQSLSGVAHTVSVMWRPTVRSRRSLGKLDLIDDESSERDKALWDILEIVGI